MLTISSIKKRIVASTGHLTNGAPTGVLKLKRFSPLTSTIFEKFAITGGGTVKKVVGLCVVTSSVVVGLGVLVVVRGLFVVSVSTADGFLVVVGFCVGLCVVTGTRNVGLLVVVNTGFSAAGVVTMASAGQQTPGTNRSLKHRDSRKLTRFSSS